MLVFNEKIIFLTDFRRLDDWVNSKCVKNTEPTVWEEF